MRLHANADSLRSTRDYKIWKMMSSLYMTYCTLQALSCINVAAPLLKKERPVHSTTLGKPASLSNGGMSQRFCEAKGEKYVICHFRFFHIQFSVRITGAEKLRSRCETSIISTSHPVHFGPQNSPQFNNVTLHTARVNSSEFEGWEKKPFHFK